MTDETRDERGRFAPEYADEDFLDAIRTHEPAGTSEVADAVGCTTQNADYRLRQLREAGRVESKKIGRSLVWMLADDRDSGS